MPIDTIILSQPLTQRGTGTTDGRTLNGISELIKHPIGSGATYNLLKRPGLANSTQPSGGAATGRGVYAWAATGKIYSVFDDKIYSGTTSLGVTMAASAGRCWFTETAETAAAQLLIVSDGSDNYNITTSDVATQIDESDDAQYPTSNKGPVVYFSNYLFQCKAGQVVNSDLNSTTAWTAGAAYSTGAYGDAIEAISQNGDQLVAYGKASMEFLFDNGNPSGSPLLAIDQNRKPIGLSTKNTLAQQGDITMFVGELSAGGAGNRAVYKLEGGSLRDVSPPSINRFLNSETTVISSATGMILPAAGHLLYVLNLSLADRSFVYNISNDSWDGEWEDANGGNKFNGIYSTVLDGVTYVQDASNGRVYSFPSTTYQDSGTTFSVTVQTEGRDQGTSARKFVNWVELVGDTQSSGTATLSYSDNDGSSFTTAGTFDLTREEKKVYRCGSYRGKRTWRLVHSQNTAFRAQALKVNYEIGL